MKSAFCGLFIACVFCMLTGDAISSAQRGNPRGVESNNVVSRTALKVDDIPGRGAARLAGDDILKRAGGELKSRAAVNVSRTAVKTTPAHSRHPSAGGELKSRAAVGNVSRAGVKTTPAHSRHPSAGGELKSRAALPAVRGHNPGQGKRAIVSASGRFVRAGEKLGEGYAACKTSYSECMGQFCAANDSYKKCLCSDRYLNMDAQKQALESVASSLNNFATINLAMVQMTEAQVKAMLTETEGEAAKVQDESRLAQQLAGIGDMVSGSGQTSNQNSSYISFDLEKEIFGGGAESAVPDDAKGSALFNAVNRQCQELVDTTCAGENLKMIVSAYSTEVEGDCNKMQLGMDKMRDQVKGQIRQAYLFLLEERFGDFENRNSMAAVECLENVLADFTNEMICGADWKLCLDPTGQYVDTKGMPVLTPEFVNFAENGGIVFPNDSQTLAEVNPGFFSMLETKRSLVDDALASCQNVADMVWTEAKNRAMVEIGQAQSRKVQEVRDVCLTRLTECNNQRAQNLSGLQDMDGTAPAGEGEFSSFTAYAASQSCMDVQRTCQNIFNSAELDAMFENRTENMEAGYCDERGVEVEVNGEMECISTKERCESPDVNMYWVRRSPSENLSEFRTLAQEHSAEDCISIADYCRLYEYALPVSGATAASGNAMCQTPTRDSCPVWIGDACIRTKAACDAQPTLIWNAEVGRCEVDFSEPEEG